MEGTNQPQPGQIVKVLRGRDAGKYAVIVSAMDARYPLIADGDKRKFDQAKRKNILHLQLLNEISREVADSLRETGRVTNGKLRFALNKYVQEHPTEEPEKGD